jgi:hypothetical protein
VNNQRHWEDWAHDTGNRQRKHKNTTQHRNLKRWATRIPPKTGGEPRCSRRVSSACLLQDISHIAQIVNTCYTIYCQMPKFPIINIFREKSDSIIIIDFLFITSLTYNRKLRHLTIYCITRIDYLSNMADVL